MADELSGQLTEQLVQITRNPSISFSSGEFIGSLVEATANVILKGWADGGVSAVTALLKAITSVKIGQSAPEQAWRLAALSFAWSIAQLQTSEGLGADALRKILRSSLDKAKSEADSGGGAYVPLDFLERPTTLPLYRTLRKSIQDNHLAFGVDANTDMNQLVSKMDIAFNRAVFEVWSRDPAGYKILCESLESPAAIASSFDLSWHSYRKELVHKFHVAPVFGQEKAKISLAQLYVPLRGIWNDGDDDIRVIVGGAGIPKNARIVLMDDDLDNWIDQGEDVDWLRLIGGGPGSGKSTTLKSLASRYAARLDWRPLFIPLQHIGIAADLRDSVNKHFLEKSDGSFTQPPLSRTALEDGPPLLLIFDGLDELVAPNDSANDVINTFSARLSNLVAALRGDGSRRIKIVVSGRMPAFQAARRFLAPPKHGCVEAFGYLPVDARELTHGSDLWAVDQRPLWWKAYAAAINQRPETPPALKTGKLSGITHEPLLCYLLVLAGYATNDWEKAAENRNRIYSTLMQNIYERGWGEGLQKRHGPGKSMRLADFLLLMETIGLAAWLGGDARVATEASFLQTTQITRAELAWESFNADNGSDVTNLAMNFYLKAAEGSQRGFEFTHKSFGEYLAARALLAVAKSVHDLVDRRIEHALKDWSEATKTGVISPEILEFMRDEVRLQIEEGGASETEVVKSVKVAFQRIAEFAINNGFPFETGTSWRVQETCQHNAEIATWSIINASAKGLAAHGGGDAAIVNIKWPTPSSLKELINRLTWTTAWSGVFTRCLSFIHAPKSFIDGVALYSVDLSGANLSGSIFDNVRLLAANLSGANLANASFHGCQLYSVNLKKADLSQSRFIDCNIIEPDLLGSIADRVRVNKDTIYMSSAGIFSDIKESIRIDSRFDGDEAIGLDKYTETSEFISSLGSVNVGEY